MTPRGGVMGVATMTDREFAKEVLGHDAPVLVAFRANWCQPSQELLPVVEEVAAEFKGRAKFVSVDVSDDPRANKMCRQYRVTRLPVVMLFEEGRVKDFIGGATSRDAIAEMVEGRLKPVHDVGAHNFGVEVLQSRIPVLAHFAAAWCDGERPTWTDRRGDRREVPWPREGRSHRVRRQQCGSLRAIRSCTRPDAGRFPRRQDRRSDSWSHGRRSQDRG